MEIGKYNVSAFTIPPELLAQAESQASSLPGLVMVRQMHTDNILIAAELTRSVVDFSVKWLREWLLKHMK